MKVAFEGRCCSDCLCFLANGEVGDAENTARVAAAIEGNWSQNEVAHMVANCGDDCEGSFSWAPCECCGSELGGDRHGFAVLASEARA